MSDTYIFDNINKYLELGLPIMSPTLYLAPGYQPYMMQAAQYVPVAPEAAVLTAEDTAALVDSCASAEQKAGN